MAATDDKDEEERESVEKAEEGIPADAGAPAASDPPPAATLVSTSSRPGLSAYATTNVCISPLLSRQEREVQKSNGVRARTATKSLDPSTIFARISLVPRFTYLSSDENRRCTVCETEINYKNNSTKVRIICPKHGEFLQTPHTHLRGVGCSLCNGTPKKTKEEFILQTRTVHGYKYDYTKVNYVNTHSKVCIICPKHGEFYQEAKSNVLGAGCPVCKESTMEKQVREYLKSQKMIFEEQKGFPWLRWKLPMRLDFYLPHYSIAIECQGHQHFQPIQFFGGEKSFKRTQLRDVRKKEQCIKRGIEILYYSNLDVPAVGTNHIFSDIANLVKFIKNIEVKV